mgnify:CR=1 FL=1
MEGNTKTVKSRLFVTNILHSKDETEEVQNASILFPKNNEWACI